MRTKKEIFEFIKNHLLTQGDRSEGAYNEHGDSSCLYRARYPDRKCALGCLIPDELYDEAIEGSLPWQDIDDPENRSGNGMIRSLWAKWQKIIDAVPEIAAYPRMLQRLQNMHDKQMPNTWPLAMDRIQIEEGAT